MITAAVCLSIGGLIGFLACSFVRFCRDMDAHEDWHEREQYRLAGVVEGLTSERLDAQGRPR